ncbi:hypothetical protein [Pedobacter sp. V48]|uniref:hypothetical protein n=1 Tax=Pedobacter sp. V48 TaxID=509635 RepID=UPI0003E5909A|nr:hypothetical protein [Pedobacter sp. V48]ETZ22855.1 hypothetical protein N824_21435 [Pedobacter sp. V48]
MAKQLNSMLSPTIVDLIHSTFLPNWPYLESLKLKPSQLLEASYDMILSNPGDVAIGINRVQVVIDHDFFNAFNCLVIKHFTSGQTTLMFNAQINRAEPVIDIYNQLKDILGNGWTFEPKFSTFSEEEKINSLANGQFKQANDEILQVWNIGQFSVLLNYKLDPLSQLLLSISHQSKKEPDRHVRANGTLLNLLKFSPEQVITMPEVKHEVKEENGAVKYVDYTFQLEESEMNLFDRVRLRIFDAEKKLDLSVQMHISYFSEFEMSASQVISLVNIVVGIYGADNSGMKEMEPHEVDQVEADEMWSGRSWTFNRAHKIYDHDEPDQSILYQASITGNPDQDGIILNILAYNQMLDFQEVLNEV